MTVVHKTILALCVVCACLSTPRQVASQTETFDIIHYTAPTGWKKTPKAQSVAYSIVNRSGFCVITVYANTASAGSSQEDFTSEWNALVVQSYTVDAKPKAETRSGGKGWTATAAASEVEEKGVKFYVVLTVFSGFGRMTSVLAELNDKAYLSEVDAFLQSVTLDKVRSTSHREPVDLENLALLKLEPDSEQLLPLQP